MWLWIWSFCVALYSHSGQAKVLFMFSPKKLQLYNSIILVVWQIDSLTTKGKVKAWTKTRSNNGAGGLLVTPALAVACVLMILIIRAELALYLHNICRVISHWAAAAPMLHSVMLHPLCAVATGSVVNVLPDCHSLLTALELQTKGRKYFTNTT